MSLDFLRKLACEQALLKDRAKKAGERSGGGGGGGERGREGQGRACRQTIDAAIPPPCKLA